MLQVQVVRRPRRTGDPAAPDPIPVFPAADTSAAKALLARIDTVLTAR